MLLNKNVVLEILQSEFAEEIEMQTITCVMDMESYELVEIFENSVDYVEVDEIDELEIVKYNTEERGKNFLDVSGIMQMRVLLEGYVHWDGENMYIGSQHTFLAFEFSFSKEEEQYGNLEMWRI